jgi:hypothetical protein
MRYPNGTVTILSPPPFSQITAVLYCPCPDGKRRKARITGQPDTYFSTPASVSISGKTVTGFITPAPTYKEGVKEGFIFLANKTGKNAHLLPVDFTDDWLRAFGDTI